MIGRSSPAKIMARHKSGRAASSDDLSFTQLPPLRPAVRTYSKRALQDSYKPPSKRQRIEVLQTIENITEIKNPPHTLSPPKKRSISEYFKSASHPEIPSSPQQPVFSSDPVKDQVESPNSSPHSSPRSSPYSSRHSSPRTSKVNTSVVSRKVRARRRLTTRPPLPPLSLNEQTSDISERKSDSDSSVTHPFSVKSSLRTPGFSPLSCTIISSYAEGEPSPIAMDSTPAAPARTGLLRSVGSWLGARTGGGRRSGDRKKTNDTALGLSNSVGVSAAADTEKPEDTPKRRLTSGPTVRFVLPESDDGPEPDAPLHRGSIPGARQPRILQVRQSYMVIEKESNTECPICRIGYDKYDPKDQKYHQKYHDDFINGYGAKKSLKASKEDKVRKIWSKPGKFGEDLIVMVDRRATQGWKDLVEEVLEKHMDKDLGCLTMTPKRLWAVAPDPLGSKTNGIVNQVPQYKFYLYLMASKDPVLGRVVSVVVAEGIKRGFETEVYQKAHDEFGEWPAIVPNDTPVIIDATHEAFIGVNKIWTHQNFRRKHLATNLLEEARKHFFYSHKVPRVHIAFTATTELGKSFATKYMAGETKYTYLTYEDAS